MADERVARRPAARRLDGCCRGRRWRWRRCGRWRPFATVDCTVRLLLLLLMLMLMWGWMILIRSVAAAAFDVFGCHRLLTVQRINVSHGVALVSLNVFSQAFLCCGDKEKSVEHHVSLTRKPLVASHFSTLLAFFCCWTVFWTVLLFLIYN